MTQKLIWLTAFAGLLLTAAGCRYENGPLVSIYSAEARLQRTWKFEEVLYNNVSIALGVKDSFNYTASNIGFSTGGNFAFLAADLHVGREGTKLYEGKWSLQHNEEQLVLAYNSPLLGTKTYRITKLSEKEAWYKLDESGSVTIFKLKQK